MAARKKTEAAQKRGAEQATGGEAEERSVEETLTEIEERIRILEREDSTLEEAFAAYAEGMALVRRCDRAIDTIEKRVQQIAEDGTLEDFDE